MMTQKSEWQARFMSLIFSFYPLILVSDSSIPKLRTAGAACGEIRDPENLTQARMPIVSITQTYTFSCQKEPLEGVVKGSK